jgi:phosphatidylserine decarboxylase
MRFQTLFEGRWIFAVILALGVFGWMLGWMWLVALAVALVIFCLNFFRDPDRISPQEADAVIAAADGTVQDIVEIDEPEFLRTRCKRVGIFLSVFDVHVNRAPIDGKVTFLKHYPGRLSRRPSHQVLDRERSDELGL